MDCIQELPLPVEDLLLDPNNYRFHDSDDYSKVSEHRYGEAGVQEKARQRLAAELYELKESLRTNGLLPFEKIVVTPYPHSQGKYLVVEGNRRLSAIKALLEEEKGGITIDDEVKSSLNPISVIVIPQNQEFNLQRYAFMGVRHVSGIKEWPGYQRAEAVADLHEKHGVPLQDIAARLGMERNEPFRRYRAYKAIQQMQEDEEFGHFARPHLYHLFHEAVSRIEFKEYMKWDDEKFIFSNFDELRVFYSLVCPSRDDDDKVIDPKVTSHKQVRFVASILGDPIARGVILAEGGSYEDAYSLIALNEIESSWRLLIKKALSAVEGLGIEVVKGMDDTDLKLLEDLKGKISERLSDYENLHSGSLGG